MTKNKLTIKVDADTTEALKQMKEVTEAANECVTALEKLENVMNKFNRNYEAERREIVINTKPFIGKAMHDAASELARNIVKGTQV